MLPLICHPDTPSASVRGIQCRAELSNDGIFWVRYHVDASPDAFVMPGPMEPSRTDGLWHTTCFEAFLRRADDAGYLEFNFAPSSQWAAYQFAGYRYGMHDLDITQGPSIDLDAGDDYFALEAVVALPYADLIHGYSMALSVIIEEADDTKSYWALAHPDGAPDFHHNDCFAAKLSARSGA